MTNHDDYLDNTNWGPRLFWAGTLAAIVAIGWFVWGIQQTREANLNATLHTPDAAKQAEDEGFKYVHFDRLRGVTIGKPDFGAPVFKGIPDDVYELNGQQVAIEGYAEPLSTLDDGKVSRFVLYRHLASCCFGEAPERNEWIEVINTTPESRSVKIRKGDGLLIYGTLHVGDRTASDGHTPLFYSLDASHIKLIEPF